MCADAATPACIPEPEIKEMDVTMTKQFKEAFAQIKVHFNDIFIALFGGGRAEVRLTDENRVLEARMKISLSRYLNNAVSLGIPR